MSMKVKLIRQFSCAPEGHTVLRFEAGSILEGSIAKMALEEGSGVEVASAPVLETKVEMPTEEKAEAPAKKKSKKG